MSSLVKKMLYGSWAVAGIAVILSLLDLTMKSPFGGRTTFDICILISAVIVGYMGFTVKKDQGT